jgi:hypothetical protein
MHDDASAVAAQAADCVSPIILSLNHINGLRVCRSHLHPILLGSPCLLYIVRGLVDLKLKATDQDTLVAHVGR